jgi:hypothetical protein
MSPTLARRTSRTALAALAALALALAPAVSWGARPAAADNGGAGGDDADPLASVPVKRACPEPARPGHVTCLALVRTDVTPQHGVQPGGRPAGLGANDLRDAYRLPTSGGTGATVAVIAVFDDPNAEADLAVYRAQYGLPPCTTANGCFRKVNGSGGTTLPRADTGWGEEMSLDLDMVSAACPNCHILLVEADEPAIPALGQGVDTAVRLGAKYVSNSYGGPEGATTSAADFGHFDHPGVAITAASGDGGYGVLFPGTSPRVTAVGGTSLTRAANARGWDETAWSGAGSGCSAYAAKPPWQQDSGCPRRTVADVSAVADPRTGVAVYDTFGFGGWLVVGGTSAATPIIAGAYALAGSPPPGAYAAALPYGHPSRLNDVVRGSTGTCDPAYLCTAGPGYDGPTGLGSPDGVEAFAASPPGLARVRRTDTARDRHTRTAAPHAGPPATPRTLSGPPARPRTVSGPPAAPGPLVNGGFESGNLSGWSASGVVTGVTKDRPHGGKYAALLGYPDDPHKGDSSIRQSFTAARNHRRLSFWYSVSCPDKVRYDWATVSLRDDTTGTTQTVLPRTCPWDETWQQAGAPIVGGHAYTLTFLSHDDGYYGDPTSAKFDDVTLS